MKFYPPVRLPLLATVLLLTPGVRAEAGAPPLITVTRDTGAEDCPSSEQLLLRVQALRRGSSPSVSEGRGELRMNVAMTHSAAGYAATLVTSGAIAGERQIADANPTCDSVAEAVAVAIAIVLDERATQESVPAAPLPIAAAPAPPVAPLVSVPPAATPTPEVPAKAAPPRPAKSDLLWEPQVAIGLSSGVLQKAALSATLALNLWPNRWLSLGVGAAALLPSQAEYRSATVDLSLNYGWAKACALPWGRREAWGLRLCAGPLLGLLRGEGRDGFSARASSPSALAWSAVMAGLTAHGPLSARLGFLLDAAVLVPTRRVGYAVEVQDKTEMAFRIPPLGVLLSAGLRWCL